MDDLAAGQILDEDVVTRDGVLLASKGQVLDEPLVRRIVNYAGFAGLKGDPVVIASDPD